MILRFTSLVLVLLLVCQTGCRRGRKLGAPRAVAVVENGRMELNLMSFNVRYENAGDVGSRAWRERIAGAVRMIRSEAPDVMGVQEALHGQAADLWASLPDYDFFGMGRDDGRRAGEYAGIFYRRERFEPDFADSGTFWLSGTPELPGSKSWGNEIPRVTTWLKLVDRSTQRAFYVFNTHWDHRHQGSRENAALLLSRRIDQRKCPDLPVALLGDFNATQRNPGLAYLTGEEVSILGREQTWSHPLKDTFQLLHATEKQRTTLHFWRGTRAGDLKVDHILVSTDAEVLSSQIRDADQPMVSDHFPVTARVSFP